MLTADRRHASRTKLDQVAYIHIEPDNGAIVLNASKEGFAFHSMAPVERNGTLRFSVKEQNRKIDISGELAWTDEIRKIGGVRFTTLTTEARDQILDWIRKSEARERSTLGSVLLRALRKSSPSFVRSFKPALGWWKSGRRLKVSGFVRGLVTGLLLSLVAFAVALFSYAHRREFGESLIRVGERLGAHRGQENAVQAPSGTVPASSISPTKATIPDAKAATPPLEHNTANGNDIVVAASSVPARIPPMLQRTQSSSPRPNSEPVRTYEASSPVAKSLASSQGQPVPADATPPTPSSLHLPANEPPPLVATAVQPVTIQRGEPVTPLSVGISPLNSNSNIQLFFDLGRFRKEWLAQDLSSRVTRLGIHATVVPRGHLWMTTYQVLVGPYDNEAAETQIKNELLSRGYKPRPYERGTRDFTFRSNLSAGRSRLPNGDVTIRWESYIADAKVKFTQGHYLVVEVDGKWVKHSTKFQNNEYVFLVQPDGSHPLEEIHFAGMDRALVLRNLH